MSRPGVYLPTWLGAVAVTVLGVGIVIADAEPARRLTRADAALVALPPGLGDMDMAERVAEELLSAGAGTDAETRAALEGHLGALVAGATPGRGLAYLKRIDELLGRIEALPVPEDGVAAGAGLRAARNVATTAFATRVLEAANAAADDDDYARLTRNSAVLAALSGETLGATPAVTAAVKGALERLNRMRVAIYGPARVKDATPDPLYLGYERLRVFPTEDRVELTVWLRRSEPDETDNLLVHASTIRLVTTTGKIDPDISALGGPEDFREGLLGPEGELSGRIVFPLGDTPATGSFRYLAYSPPSGRKPIQRPLPKITATDIAAGYLDRAVRELAAPLGSAERAARDVEHAATFDPRLPGLDAARAALAERATETGP